MSLIDDALNRAREEAVRQEAARKSGTSRWAPSHVPGARKRASGPAALIAVFLAGVALAWFLLQRGPGTVSSGPLPAPPAALARPTATAGEAAASSRPVVPESAKPPSRRARPTSSPARSEESPAASPSSTPSGSSSRAGHSEPAPARKTFVRMAALPGGETIELGGIVYSEGNPVALLNGKVVAPGGSVGNYTVVAVLPERVDFEGEGTTFSILLR